MSLFETVEEAATGRLLGQAGEGGFIPAAGETSAPGMGPYRLAAQRMRHNKTALAFGLLFLLVVLVCLLAPVYAHDIAHTGPNAQHINEVLHFGGKSHYVVGLTGIPIGPTWHSKFFLGADPNGRDLAVRLLYGGRTSLLIGGVATVITIVLATILGLFAGFYRGLTDGVISRILDIIWAFPALLLAIALGVSLALGGISIGPLHLQGNSIYIPAVIIGIVYIPYVARPVRGEVMVLREREFVDAARILGFGNLRIMFGEILPNLTSTLVVFVALQLAQSIILEAALSYLNAGVQAPNASWGTLLSSGTTLFAVAPHLTLAPAIMLVVACLGVNIFGDGLRDALDPRARIRVVR
jgi:peptide/nickel transport system permease protein